MFSLLWILTLLVMSSVCLDYALGVVADHLTPQFIDQVIGPYGLLATKARILVTNGISFLKHFDQVVYIRRGIILESGSYESLVSNDQTELYKLMYVHMICLSFNGSFRFFYSKGHGTLNSSSGVSTPFTGGGDSSTPASDTAHSSSQSLTSETLDTLTEKLQRKRSFGKATLADALPTRTPSPSGPSKEHTEQGRVKKDVYIQYVEAASKIGFAIFVVSVMIAQLVSLAANNTLRAWGEHNREAGSNAGVGKYLLGYGLFSLSSTLLGAFSAIVIWVFCSIRSAKRLHDSVSLALCFCSGTLWYFDELT